MTAREFIAQLAPVDLDRLSTVFHSLSEHTLGARLEAGRRLTDVMDFREYLEELSEAARVAHTLSQRKLPSYVRDRRVLQQLSEQTPRRPFADSCPRCGHVHQGVSECGEPMGGGRICRCEMEVHA